jgi:hypothetical protein
MNKEQAIEWLLFNYSLRIGDKISFIQAKEDFRPIYNIKPTDDIGHYRTQYPVVIGIYDEMSIMPDKTEWMTIESIFGF